MADLGSVSGVGRWQATREGEALVVFLDGELDFQAAPEIREHLIHLLARGVLSLVIDLERCSYVDSSGVLALLAVADRAAELGGSLRIRNASLTLRKLLHLMHLSARLGVPGEGVTPRRRRRLMDTGVGKWDVARFVLPAVPKSCATARHIALAEAAETPLSPDDCADLELAVGEAVANAVRHGSPRGADDRITMRALRGHDAFVIEVADGGQGFDRSRIKLPHPEEIREGGMGIYYMETVMDGALFESGRSGTTVRLTKAYPQAAAGAASDRGSSSTAK